MVTNNNGNNGERIIEDFELVWKNCRCGKSFLTKTGLVSHIRKAHIHKCSCGKSFLTEAGFMSHIRKAHKDPKVVQQAIADVKKKNKKNKKIKCLECPIKFDVDDKEGIFSHWEADHRDYSEDENPYHT